jgi:hypothetical protein
MSNPVQKIDFFIKMKIMIIYVIAIQDQLVDRRSASQGNF